MRRQARERRRQRNIERELEIVQANATMDASDGLPVPQTQTRGSTSPTSPPLASPSASVPPTASAFRAIEGGAAAAGESISEAAGEGGGEGVGGEGKGVSVGAGVRERESRLHSRTATLHKGQVSASFKSELQDVSERQSRVASRSLALREKNKEWLHAPRTGAGGGGKGLRPRAQLTAFGGGKDGEAEGGRISDRSVSNSLRDWQRGSKEIVLPEPRGYQLLEPVYTETDALEEATQLFDKVHQG